MLVAAALVPETVLLLPGAAGSASVLPDERAAAAQAVRSLLDAHPERVVVVVTSPGASTTRLLADPVRPSVGGAGVPHAVLGSSSAHDGPRGRDGATLVPDVGASVLVALLRASGWAGAVDVLLLADDDDGAEPRAADPTRTDPALGAPAVPLGPGRTALLLGGSLSARHGPDGPLPDDPRAPEVDRALARDLAAADGPARARLAAFPAADARALAISAHGPWRVLLRAARDLDLRGHLLLESAPSGAAYAVLAWEVV